MDAHLRIIRDYLPPQEAHQALIALEKCVFDVEEARAALELLDSLSFATNRQREYDITIQVTLRNKDADLDPCNFIAS